MARILLIVFAVATAYVVAGGDRKATEFFVGAFNASAAKISQAR